MANIKKIMPGTVIPNTNSQIAGTKKRLENAIAFVTTSPLSASVLCHS